MDKLSLPNSRGFQVINLLKMHPADRLASQKILSMECNYMLFGVCMCCFLTNGGVVVGGNSAGVEEV